MADVRRRRGRPAIVPDGELAAHVHVKLGADLYDALYRLAEAERVSVPEIIRRAATRLTAVNSGTQNGVSAVTASS